MLSIEEIKLYLKENLKSNRYNHTLGVVETAKKLAEVNKISIEKAEIAALAHDVAKNLSLQKMQSIIEKNNIELTNTEKENSNLWHSIIAPIEARNKLKIDDKDILDAVRWHTTGKENMSILTKIIYIADMIEPGRDFPGVEKIRQTTFENLDEGVLLGLTESMKDLLNRNLIIDLNTIKARNYFLLKETMC
ncbi:MULTISPECIES: bis(5'-nucleosyl)-tetraphosphatase (symmetrical) YqeK [Clostridium]|uniref:bis(5'-nucleosyl)-tetraphosphatase (symmetrical) YqeK n=1 Tax=Clostridium TaxID=1485 RepID=UPI0007736CFA|nr:MULTISPECIES: bis(5'-nucleosyl)-tetraphosphatase (symmetrical) YqeK [Clostridium]MBN1040974.1 HD domain-containing protein [Clostridium botulinum]MBY7024081.1 bis(5'-nucleosyl)-tetraphosphatase (symmetrical) YqeK [Clostridium botulinum]NFG57407.1 HD domain-containing protein [Clostridium botulinum]NFH79624.1 HD domain-containing protein [Clostridium botulinum]NFH82531.1 HD domain-containing protein [Clostridium botulinum]